MRVWSCPEGATGVIPASGGEAPLCASGQGQWVELPQSLLQTPVDGESFAGLLSIVALLFAVAYTIKVLRRVLENRR